ncbi:MAG: branched-chain amino acid ABC transporter permease, partial [Reyranella sp.]|nr:branched-chain amino acid ABC transporter permease [Reyranella sp.]
MLLGGFYACMALGFSIVWGVMNVVNLAYGSMIMIGAYVTQMAVLQLGLPLAAALPLAALATFTMGYVLQRALLNRLAERSVFMTLIFTFGLNMALINLNLILFSADVRSLPDVFGRASFTIAGLSVPYGRATIFAVAMAMTLGLHALLNWTPLGNAIKATSFDPDAAPDEDSFAENQPQQQQGPGALQANLGIAAIPLNAQIARQLGVGEDTKGVVIS